MFYSAALLHLIKQKFLLIFLGTLILMTQVFLYLFSFLEIIWNCIIFLQLPIWLERSKRTLICQRRLVLNVFLLKNCEPELSYILAKLFNICLKESCFPRCWEVSSVVPGFKNDGERSTAQNCRPGSPLFVVSKLFEKLVNNRFVNHL